MSEVSEEVQPLVVNNEDVASAEKALMLVRGYRVSLSREHPLCLLFAAQRLEDNTARYKVAATGAPKTSLKEARTARNQP